MENASAVEALLRKREELLISARGIQSAIYHIEQSLALIGYANGEMLPRRRRFANGELIALIGEAERGGHTTVSAVARYIVSAKGWDPTDDDLTRKIRYSVKECRSGWRGVSHRRRAIRRSSYGAAG